MPVALAPFGRDGNLAPAGEIGGGERFLGLEHLFQRAFGHHLAPVDAGAGAEIMQRIAVPMIGGMVSSTLLTLIVIPAVYAIIKGWSFKKAGTAPDLALGQAAE